MRGLSMISWLKTTALVGLVSMALLSACKQGEGEVCQIDDDCEDGLICNQQTAECQSTGGGETPDAGPVIDGPPGDATPDPIDATPPAFDAAPPAFDASPPSFDANMM